MSVTRAENMFRNEIRKWKSNSFTDKTTVFSVCQKVYDKYGKSVAKSPLFKAIQSWINEEERYKGATLTVQWEDTTEELSPSGEGSDVYHPAPCVAVAFEMNRLAIISEEDLDCIVTDWIDEYTGFCHTGYTYRHFK